MLIIKRVFILIMLSFGISASSFAKSEVVEPSAKSLSATFAEATAPVAAEPKQMAVEGSYTITDNEEPAQFADKKVSGESEQVGARDLNTEESSKHEKNAKESEIALNLDKQSKATDNQSNPVSKLLLTFVLLGFLGLGAFFVVKKYAGIKNSPHTQIKVLTQHYLGPKKSLAIIRVAGESILIGVTDHNISLIKSLAMLDEEIPENTPNNFKGALKNIEFASADEGADSTQEDFAISGIKDVVNKKLKNMRTI